MSITLTLPAAKTDPLVNTVIVEAGDGWIFEMAATMPEPTPGLAALRAALQAVPSDATESSAALRSETLAAAEIHAELQAIRGAMVAELLHQGGIRIRNPTMLATIVERLSARQPRLGRLATLIGFFQRAVDGGQDTVSVAATTRDDC